MAYIGKDFDDANPVEVETYTLSFAKDMDPLENIVGIPVWSIAVVSGSDSSFADRILSAAIADNKTTSIVMGTFVAGVKYRVSALATTSNGDQVLLYSHITCVAPS